MSAKDTFLSLLQRVWAQVAQILLVLISVGSARILMKSFHILKEILMFCLYRRNKVQHQA